jgi:hypothetical protein
VSPAPPHPTASSLSIQRTPPYRCATDSRQRRRSNSAGMVQPHGGKPFVAADARADLLQDPNAARSAHSSFVLLCSGI